MAILEKLTPPNADEDIQQRKLSLIPGGNSKWYSHFGSQFGSFFVSPQHLCIKILSSSV